VEETKLAALYDLLAAAARDLVGRKIFNPQKNTPGHEK